MQHAQKALLNYFSAIIQNAEENSPVLQPEQDWICSQVHQRKCSAVWGNTSLTLLLRGKCAQTWWSPL